MAARILTLQDALDYLRLCDGDDDYVKALRMVTDEYKEMRERYGALRASFAVEVEAAFNRKLDDKEREITRLKEQVQLDRWRQGKVREALYATPEDEDDT